MNRIKEQLHALCHAYVDERIKRTENALATAQKAANQESKSSAGDKYETGRAMMHLEKEKHAVQLAATLKLKKVLDEMSSAPQDTGTAQLGTLVTTDQGLFYLSIGAGKIVYEGQDYYAISPTSPLGQQLVGQSAGIHFSLNGRRFQLLSIT